MACALLLLLWPDAGSATPQGPTLSLCFARVRHGDTPAAMLASPARFTCAPSSTSWGRGDFWAIARHLPAGLGRRHPVDVRFASLWQDRVTLWIHYADGALWRETLDGHGFTRHLRLGAFARLRAPEHAGGAATTLLWRVDGAANLRGIVNGASAGTPAESATADLKLAAFYSAFGGLCVALLIYNLAIWAALRHRFQLAYCVMVTALLAYAASSSGAIAWLLPDMANNDRLRINYLTLAAAAAAAVFFARSFFEERVFADWLGTVSIAVAVITMTCALLFAGLAPTAILWVDRLYSTAFLLMLAIVVPVLWRAWRLNSRYLGLFALAWGAPIIFAVVRVLGALDMVGWSWWLDNSTILSMTLEALLSSLAIAYRIHLLSRERDEAQRQETMARELADRDPLTGLLNRRAFLREAIGREGDQLLVIADIDHFKAVNDTLGHDGGDEVLRLIARALEAAAPAGTLVARLGGEEFALVAPLAAGLTPAALLMQVRRQRMPFDLGVTVSLGSCRGELACEGDWKTLYRAADGALFEAKAAGRDRARDAVHLARAA